MVTERGKGRKRSNAARMELERKNEINYSGKIRMERCGKLQGKRLDNRGRLRWRSMSTG